MNKSNESSSLSLIITSYLLILLIALVAYSNTFNVPFHYDDRYVIRDNPDVKGVDAFLKSLSEKEQRPVLMFTFAVNYELNALNVAGYHIVNFLLHLLSSYLVFSILKHTLYFLEKEKISRLRNNLFALLPALLFASHPLATESVTYISSRSSLLSTFFILLGLFFFIKAYEGTGFKRPLSLFSIVSFVLAVGCKEIAIIFPLIVLSYDFYFMSSDTRKAEKLKYFYAPSFFITFLLLIIKFRFVFTLASPDETARSLYSHILTELCIIPKFLIKFFIPLNLNIAHYFELKNSIFSLAVFSSIVLWIALLFFTKILFRNYRLLSFSILWIIITILPFLLFPLSDLMSERWLYLSIAGFSFFISGLLMKLSDRGFKKTPIAVIFAVMVLLFTAGTYSRNNAYRSGISLWTDAVEKSPQNARAQGNLAYSYQMAGFPYKAIKYYEASLNLDPFYPATYYNLGVIYQRLGSFPQAVQYYRKDLSLNPGDFEAHLNLGIIYQNSGNPDKAIEYFQSASNLNPSDAGAHSNLGMAYMGKGMINEAIGEYESALSINPQSAEIHNNLAIAFAYKGLTDKAIAHLKKSIAISPEFARAHFNLSALYKNIGMLSEAKAHYDKAVKLNPEFARKK